ncbi:MAG: hypothetical protein J6A51_02905 [Clostridia bacterium]|nr:hypothetical protein [Clostridia bacterium]
MKKKKNQTNLIFLHKLIKSFADSLVKAFVPLIILKNTNSLLLVAIYLIAEYAFFCIFNLGLKKFLQKYGIVAMVLHIVPIIALQFLLTLEIDIWMCLVLGMLGSLSLSLYSVPLNLLFAFTDKNVNVAKFQIATNIGKLIFILIGGYIIGSDAKNSILFLSIFGTALYVMSIIPILYGYNLMKTKYDKIAAKHPEINKGSYKYFNLYHMFFSMFQGVLDQVVPLYLYIENLTFESVTIVMALIEVCKIGANLLAKQLVLKKKAKLSCFVSATCFSIGSIVMMTVRVPVVLYICTCAIAISFPLLFVPMFRLFIKKIVRENNQFDGMSYRDVYIAAARPIVFAPCLLISNLMIPFALGLCAAVGIGVCCNKVVKK